jgi:RNA polymerase sigma-70 factor (ECF subfamily)
MVLNTETIYQDFSGQLLRFIEQRVPEPDTAEDILQDVFLRIHNHVDSLRDDAKLQSWVYQIARNAIVDYYRGRRETTQLTEDLSLPVTFDLPDATQDLIPSVRQLINCLPENYRQPLILSEYEGLTQQEIAERLGLSLSGAKSRVQRAREKIKDMFLDCCHFELDRTGNILDYYPRQSCCTREHKRGNC